LLDFLCELYYDAQIHKHQVYIRPLDFVIFHADSWREGQT